MVHASGELFTDLDYLLGVELLATERVIAALVEGVADVVTLRAEAQMIRVDAARIVAGVHDHLARWHVLRVREFPREDMGANTGESLVVVALDANATATWRSDD